ncbi:MAG: anti-sigma factor antagonist, partial [Oscillospiraceae bacterium]
MTTFFNGSVLLVRLDGRVDSGNAAETEKTIFDAVEQYAPLYAVIDAEKLEYISSVGLRVLLKLKKKIANTQLINVSAEVYEVLDMTGFTDIMDIKKALRQVSVDGCRVIGRGAFGTTYKLDNDTIVKVFTEGVAYEDIIREKESAKAAFICGVPTAIPFDTVKVGNRYGNVYELINARAFSEDICGNLSKIDDYARQATELLKLLASTRDSKGAFRSFKQTSLEKIDHLNRSVKGWEVFTPEEMELLFKLFYAVPERDTLIHGDFHTHNIFEQDGELLLIDMADTGTGHPIFELGNMYLPFVIMAEYEDDRTNQLIGMDNKTAVLF